MNSTGQLSFDADGPHAGQPVMAIGIPLEQADGAMILIHGRGANGADILSLTAELDQSGMAFIAPQAESNTWYPYSFLVPLERNEPGLSSGLSVIGGILRTTEQAGIPRERTILLGFSQGACLSLEFAARNAGRFGGVVGLSGGVIGPDDAPRDYTGSLSGTPVFLGCSDVDPHIPVGRVHETAEIMERLGGDVTLRIYPGMAHTVIENEIAYVRELASRVGNDT